MDPIAIVMMVIMCAVIWGGLVLALMHLLKHPDENSGELGREPEAGDPRYVRTAEH
jgi:hypothetical protein